MTRTIALACLGFATVAACSSSYAEAPAPGSDAGADSAADAGVEAGVALEAGAEAGGACTSSCPDGVAACTAFDFATGCPSGWVFSGDATQPGVVGQCADGKVRVSAKSTLDMVGRLAVGTPAQFDAIHVSARVAVTQWDGGRLLLVEGLGGTPAIEIDAAVTASGGPLFWVCVAGNCARAAGAVTSGEESVLALDITRTKVTLSVNCVPAASQAATSALAPSSEGLVVSFGKLDANAIDGTLDDLVVAFR